MAKGKRQNRAPFQDPRRDLPSAPAMQSGLKIERVEQHRRGEHRARRETEWDRLRRIGKLTDLQHQAADEYAARAAEQLGSPAPRSCLDIAIGGHDDSDPSRAEVAAYREWRALNAEMPFGVQVEMQAVLWGGHWCRQLSALQQGLDHVADFLGLRA